MGSPGLVGGRVVSRSRSRRAKLLSAASFVCHGWEAEGIGHLHVDSGRAEGNRDNVIDHVSVQLSWLWYRQVMASVIVGTRKMRRVETRRECGCTRSFVLHVRCGDIEAPVLDLRRGVEVAEQPVNVDVQLEDTLDHIRGFLL